MLLSVVTGTYQRIAYLKKLVQSVRGQLPVGVSYEIIVVDGGSGDGTEAWCREQHDIVFIQQGQLLGAIAAFCAGAQAAHGDYVVLANDDVEILDGTLITAAAYLDTHPDCGAVAFQENRAAPGYGTDYHVQTINVVRSSQQAHVPYAQTGMFRRWLGDLCRWWDMSDPLQATYGGDAYLSAMIWQYGYTVDEVDGCRIDDQVAPDALRERNALIEQQNGSAYYRRFPNGVHVGLLPKPANPQREHLRILYVPLYDPSIPHRYKRGLRDALSEVGAVCELDYLVGDYPTSLYELTVRWQPHLLLLQFHGSDRQAADVIRYARSLAPHMVVVNWNGDNWPDKLTAPDYLDFLKTVDLHLVVNADVLPVYAAHGITAAYWQIGFENVPDVLPDMPAYDILFLGNNYSPKREQLGDALRHAVRGASVGIYGYNWPHSEGTTLYDFPKSAALYRACKIAVGDNQFGDQGFVSNRLFEALANGAFLLHQRVPGLEALTGIRADEHYVEWGGSGDLARDLADLRDKLAYWLVPAHAARRMEIARTGEQFARQQHSFQARVRQLFTELLPLIQEKQYAE